MCWSPWPTAISPRYTTGPSACQWHSGAVDWALGHIVAPTGGASIMRRCGAYHADRRRCWSAHMPRRRQLASIPATNTASAVRQRAACVMRRSWRSRLELVPGSSIAAQTGGLELAGISSDTRLTASPPAQQQCALWQKVMAPVVTLAAEKRVEARHASYAGRTRFCLHARTFEHTARRTAPATTGRLRTVSCP